MNGAFTVDTDQWLPKPVHEVFGFFGDAGNLEMLTPPWLRFEILTPRPIAMQPGALIDYRLRLRGVPVRWRTRIRVWEPTERFVDEQIRGPYTMWVHEHRFAPEGDGTRVRDHVTYRVPGGRLVNALFVRRDVERIFRFRAERLAEHFGGDDRGLVELGAHEERDT